MIPRKILPFLVLCILLTNNCFTQLQLTPSNDANLLAQTIVGKGVTISNAKFTGAPTSSGLFKNNNLADIGIQNGILLTSGTMTQVANPVNFHMSVSNGYGGDPDLSNLVKTATHNASVLEFDFTSVGDSILVNFVFASEEYPIWGAGGHNYNCSDFNDAFAFLITGPGYTTPTNIALVPGTNIPVAINSINDGTAPNGNLPCTQLGPGSPFTNLYVKNNGNQKVAFNGYTVVLTAKAKVQPCMTYHIKLAIADVSDASFDSGVFIEAESFKSNVVTLGLDAFYDNNNGNFLVEGCKPGKLTLKRLCSDDGSQPLDLEFLIGGTATPGTDYKAFPATIQLAAGEFERTFDIAVVNDFVPEADETIVINIRNITTNELGKPVTLTVKDQVIFHKNVDTFVCSAFGKELLAQKVDTTTNSYLWSTGATTQQLMVTQPGVYWVEHRFAQNCYNVDTFFVASGDPTVNIGPDITYCAYDSVRLDAQNAGSVFMWNTGETTQTIYAKAAGAYWARVTNEKGCYVSDTLVAFHKTVPMVRLGNDTALCDYEELLLDATFPGASYTWHDGSAAPLFRVTTGGSYSVQTELNGCIWRDTIVVADKQMPVPGGRQDLVLETPQAMVLQASQHANNAAFRWVPDFYLNNPNIRTPFANLLNDVTYRVEISSADGCVLTDTVNVFIKDLLHVPNVFSPNQDGINDSWVIPLLDTYKIATVEVYNRYGRLVYRSVGYPKPWDGTVEGKPLPVGTYYYYINPNNGKKMKKGSVTILR